MWQASSRPEDQSEIRANNHGLPPAIETGGRPFLSAGRREGVLLFCPADISKFLKSTPMPSTSSSEITKWLQDWRNGDQTALERLMPVVYRELHKLAHAYLNRERPGHTLQPTALINEAYLRLVAQNIEQWQNRAHFYG